MRTESKNIKLRNTARLLPFPWRVQDIGYTSHAAPVKLLSNRFGGNIEICLRLRSYEDGEQKSEQTIGDCEYRNTYPHILIKHPGVSFCYHHLGERDVVYFIYDSGMFGELEKLGVFEKPYCWDIEISPEMDFFIQQLRKWMNISQESGISDRIDATCFHLLNELLLQRKRHVQRLDPIMETMAKIDSYFQFHMLEDIDIDELAAKYELSRCTFFRYWRHYNELSPARYMLDLKLREACRQLSSGADKIHVIAEALNFRDTAYFCAVFRKKYGMTPVEYRKQQAHYVNARQ